MNERIKYIDPEYGARTEFARGHGLESNPYSIMTETWKYNDFGLEMNRLQSEEFRKDCSMLNNPVIEGE